MMKHRFSYVERYSLWRAYDGHCFFCEKPLDFQDMTVDHIVPKWLTEHPEKLRHLRLEYEIDIFFPGFQSLPAAAAELRVGPLSATSGA